MEDKLRNKLYYLRTQYLTPTQKARIINQCILPAVMYGGGVVVYPKSTLARWNVRTKGTVKAGFFPKHMPNVAIMNKVKDSPPGVGLISVESVDKALKVGMLSDVLQSIEWVYHMVQDVLISTLSARSNPDGTLEVTDPVLSPLLKACHVEITGPRFPPNFGCLNRRIICFLRAHSMGNTSKVLEQARVLDREVGGTHFLSFLEFKKTIDEERERPYILSSKEVTKLTNYYNTLILVGECQLDAATKYTPDFLGPRSQQRYQAHDKYGKEETQYKFKNDQVPVPGANKMKGGTISRT